MTGPSRYIFAGAGLAGLSLAAELLAATKAELLLIDPLADRLGLEAGAGFDRTLGFWCEGPPPFAELVERSWTQLAIHSPDGRRVLELEPFRYHALRWSTLRDALLAELRASPRVAVRVGRVEALASTEVGAEVEVNGERLAADLVFDSRLDPRAIHPRAGRVLLWQRFHGARVRAEQARFDPSCATFMDLRATRGAELAFLNVLPEDERTALVYRVEIAERGVVRSAELDADLRELCGLERWQVLAQERGVLPMGDLPFARRAGPRVLRIGNAGGRLKDSSGYAFTRILADNRAILDSLARRGHPFDLPTSPLRYRFLDAVLLAVLRDAPQLGPEIFAALFARPAPQVLRFLDERASLGDLLAIMLAMPHKPRMAWTALGRALAWLRSPGARALPPATRGALPPGDN